MHKLFLPALLSLTLLAAAVAQQAAQSPQAAPEGTYKVDPAHATIGFVVRHLGISDIAGKFNEVEGQYTLGDKPTFQATVAVDSVDTGVEKRDDHLESEDFFNEEKFPTIEFRSKSVERSGDTYNIVADFTMHGETKEITLPLKYLGTADMQGQLRTGFTGEVTIDRREWGLTAWQGMVGNEVKLVISFEGIKQ